MSGTIVEINQGMSFKRKLLVYRPIRESGVATFDTQLLRWECAPITARNALLQSNKQLRRTRGMSYDGVITF